MKILLLTGPSQVGKSYSSAEYCRSRLAAHLEGDDIFNHWFQAIGQTEYIYKKGSFREWEHLIADERYASRLRAAHQQAVAGANHDQLILEGVMYRHERIRTALFSSAAPHSRYGLVDYRRTAGDFVRQALGKRNYYPTKEACLASWRTHAEQFDPPPHPWFSRQVVSHQEFVNAASDFFER